MGSIVFTQPLTDSIVTRDFYFKSSLYIGGQHAASDKVPRIGPAWGAPVRAIADWKAVGVGWDFYSGFFVALDHAGGYRSTYRHLYGQSPVVVGQRGKQGQIIGNVGNTGWSQGSHLHIDLWNRNKVWAGAFYKNGWWALDPELYLGVETVAQPEEEEDDMLIIYATPTGQQVALGPYRVIVTSAWLRVLMKGPHKIIPVTKEELRRIPLFPNVVNDTTKSMLKVLIMGIKREATRIIKELKG